jgi:adenine/guanine/hypoxanthine permease
MVWAAMLAALIDAKPWRAVTALAVGAVFTAFGVMHSAHPQGGLYWPWMLEGQARGMMLDFLAAYLVLAVLLAMLAFTGRTRAA